MLLAAKRKKAFKQARVWMLFVLGKRLVQEQNAK
jgi:hypothetical protein